MQTYAGTGRTPEHQDIAGFRIQYFAQLSVDEGVLIGLQQKYRK